MKHMNMAVFENIQSDDWQRAQRLIDRCFPNSHANRAVVRLRKNKPPVWQYCMVAHVHGEWIGCVLCYYVTLPSGACVPLLGPIAVDIAHRGQGLGSALVSYALHEIAGREDGVLIVGDEAYYSVYGFDSLCTKNMSLQGDIDPFTFLGLEFEGGIFTQQNGMVTAQ